MASALPTRIGASPIVSESTGIDERPEGIRERPGRRHGSEGPASHGVGHRALEDRGRDDLEDEAAGRCDREGDERDREGLGEPEDRETDRGHDATDDEDARQPRPEHEGAGHERAEDAADADRGVEPARTRLAGAVDGRGEHDGQHGDAAEREARHDVHGREADDDAGRELLRLELGLGLGLGHRAGLGRRNGLRGRPRQGCRRRQPRQHDRDDGEGGRVQNERQREPAERDQQAGDRGPEGEREVVERGPRRVGRPELALVGDQGRQVRADRRAEERREARGEDRERHDCLDRAVRRDQPGEHDHDRAASDVRGDEDPPPVEPVRHDAGRHREQDVRQDARRADDAQQDRVLGPRVHDDQQRDQVEPVPDRADELAEQQADERAVCEELAVCAEPAQETVTRASARSGPARART